LRKFKRKHTEEAMRVRNWDGASEILAQGTRCDLHNTIHPNPMRIHAHIVKKRMQIISR